jgi:transposase
MIQLVPHMRILIAVAPVDFRRGIDGLAALCRSVLNEDPMTGTVFLFRNRVGTAVKILVYDGKGFWLCHRRFSRGRLHWWPTDPSALLSTHQVSVLLAQGDPRDVRLTPDWRPIATATSPERFHESSSPRPDAPPSGTTTR